MSNIICYNFTGTSKPVWEKDGSSGSWGKQVGTIRASELFVFYGANSEGNGAVSIGFFSPTGWRQGYVKQGDATASFLSPAYQTKWSYGQYAGYNKFKVLHRQSRIFSGGNIVAAVKPGGYILTNSSIGGSKYPYRLSIAGFIPAGKNFMVRVTNGWCDTDIEIGCSLARTVTTEANWL